MSLLDRLERVREAHPVSVPDVHDDDPELTEYLRSLTPEELEKYEREAMELVREIESGDSGGSFPRPQFDFNIKGKK